MAKGMLKIAFVGLCLCWVVSSEAQTEDFELWTGAKLEIPLTKKLSTSLAQAYRMNENISAGKKSFTEFAAGYRLHKYVRFAGKYRYSQMNHLFDAEHIEHRFGGDLILKYKLEDLTISVRSRYQREFRDPFTSEMGKVSTGDFRNKLTVSYFTPKLEPYLAAELFEHLDYTGNYISRYRVQLGAKVDVGKRKELDVSYMVQKRVQSNDNRLSHVFGLSFSYEMKRLFPKKKKIAD